MVQNIIEQAEQAKKQQEEQEQQPQLENDPSGTDSSESDGDDYSQLEDRIGFIGAGQVK